jgi:hypothetical protein
VRHDLHSNGGCRAAVCCVQQTAALSPTAACKHVWLLCTYTICGCLYVYLVATGSSAPLTNQLRQFGVGHHLDGRCAGVHIVVVLPAEHADVVTLLSRRVAVVTWVAAAPPAGRAATRTVDNACCLLQDTCAKGASSQQAVAQLG